MKYNIIPKGSSPQDYTVLPLSLGTTGQEAEEHDLTTTVLDNVMYRNPYSETV